ncbi:uncharacterized protein LOC135089739 [Scylla paramamosain]|uniref:uncharacterized protein LOC135089739 n=1 Tax=Scylla paramamosain TaxID=85552 RepID=UPI003082D7F1
MDYTCLDIRNKLLISGGSLFGCYAVIQVTACVLRVKLRMSTTQHGTNQMTQATTLNNQAFTSTPQQHLSPPATSSSPRLQQHPFIDPRPSTIETTQATAFDNQAFTSTPQQHLSSAATISSPHLQQLPFTDPKLHHDLDQPQICPEGPTDLTTSQTSQVTSL